MNGLIKAKIQQSGGRNSSGEPIKATSSWGEPVPCLYYANTLNNRGIYQDGDFVQSVYIITVKDMEFSASQIQLIDSRGNVVCEKEVQSLEVLSVVKRVKITV